MHDLIPITALGGNEAHIETIGKLTCREVPGVALAAVSARMGRESQTRTAIKKLIKSDTPDISRFDGGTITAFWSGLEQWMLEAPFDSHEDLAARAKVIFKANATVVEQTDAWTRFDVFGDNVANAMELLCNANTRSMAAGDCTRSSIHHLSCFILCRSNDEFSVYGPRASAKSLHHAILTVLKTIDR